MAISKQIGRHQIFLDLFSGSGGIRNEIQKRSGFGCFSMDITIDPAFDLTSPTVCNMLIGWIGTGLIRGVFLAPPCSTWSMASRGRYRTARHIYGLPLLDAAAAGRVLVGNLTLKSAQRVIKSCNRHGIAAILENPQSSLMWREPVMAQLVSLSRARLAVTDFCQHGTRWRKSTRFASWNCQLPPSPMCHRCHGRQGICSATNLPHISLEGGAPGGARWTAIASPYPASINRLASRWLVRSAASVESVRQNRLVGKISVLPV